MTSAFRFFFSIVFLLVAAAQAPAQSQASGAAETNEESIKILLITSGCCHDYDFQTKAMQLALKKHGGTDVVAIHLLTKPHTLHPVSNGGVFC